MMFLRTIFFTIFAVSCVNSHLGAMEEKPSQPQTIHTLPAYYVKLAQQVKNGRHRVVWIDFLGHIFFQYKENFANYEHAENCADGVWDKVDGKISAILSLNALQVCKDAWIIHSCEAMNSFCLSLNSYDYFGSYDSADIITYVKNEVSKFEQNRKYYYKNYEDDLYQIAQFLYAMKHHSRFFSQEDINEAYRGLTNFRRSMCSVEDLEKIYEKIIKALRKGWKSINHEFVSLFERSQEGFIFAKQNAYLFFADGLLQEDLLINCLAEKFGLENDIEYKEGCLWVRKETFKQVQSVFDLEINKNF